MVPWVSSKAASYFERVLKTIRRKKTDFRALSFENDVRGNCRTVYEKRATFQHLLHGNFPGTCRKLYSRHCPLTWIGRDGWNLEYFDLARRSCKDKVSECPADIHTNSPGFSPISAHLA